jgi:hypothetical protein
MSQWPTGSMISKVLRDLQGFVYLQAQVVIGPENQGVLRDGRVSKALAGKGIGSSEPPLELWLSERGSSNGVVLGNHPISVRRQRKDSIMSFGFTAYHTERCSPDTTRSADLRVAVRATLAALSWSVREESHDQIAASTSMNFRSWGEKVLISFLPDKSISVTSKCSLPTQCFDWGKNKANLARFMKEIRKHV